MTTARTPPRLAALLASSLLLVLAGPAVCAEGAEDAGGVPAALAAPAARGEAQSADAAGQDLSARLAGLDHFHTRFQQRLYDARGALLRETGGELWAQRPDRFRWVVQPPFAETLVGDGHMLWLWDPDLEQVTVRPYDARMQGTPALLLSGRPDELVRGFRVDRVHADASGAEFRLTPRDDDGLFSSLDLTFARGLPATLVIHDGLGQRTEVTFQDFDPAAPVDADRFSFQVPEGADVLREDAVPAPAASDDSAPAAP